MPVGSEAKWNAAFEAATTLSPAEDWRNDLASAVREAARAEFVSIMTCPPGDWTTFRTTTHPFDHGALVAQIDRDFKPRIEATGEGWQQAVRVHGRVYTPLEVVATRPLAEELRDVVMRPADIDGYVVAYLRKIYGKLGVRSRVQLAMKLREADIHASAAMAAIMPRYGDPAGRSTERAPR
jgi:hypothetical protein